MMKKLLLILLYLPMIFSCGDNDKEKNDTKEIIENNCDFKPDYTMSAVDFLKMIQTSNDKFHGKIFEINVEFGMRFISVGTELGSIIDPEASFMYVNSFKYNYTGRLDFKLLPFTKNDEDYWQELDELSMKGTEPVFKIKGTLVREKSDTSSNVYEFINCCLVIPNQSNSAEEKSTIAIPQPKIDEIIENRTPIDTSEMEDESTYKTEEYSVTDEEEFYRGVINDPDGYTNVREDKSSKSEIVFKVYEGEEFEIIDDSDDNWWMIKYNGKQGYIYWDRIDIIE